MSPNADLGSDVAGLFREALKARRITQAAFARRIGRSEKHVSQVLSGKAATTVDEWAAWAYEIDLRFVVRLEASPNGSSGIPDA